MMSAATPSVPSHGDRDRDPTVLVVEEDDVARSFLAENLEADRFRVRIADSREKALAILSVQQPDVIVVDVNGKTLDLIDAIRNGDGLAGRVDPDTPLIVLTTRVDEVQRIRVLDRGGDDVLAKPYSYPELRARIAQPATLTALQAELRRRGKRIGSVHGRLELLALRGRVSKTWLLGEIAWTIVPATTRNERSAGRGTPA
jgi:DNA-binding response OmpR family regulator